MKNDENSYKQMKAAGDVFAKHLEQYSEVQRGFGLLIPVTGTKHQK